jgi:hypothetical protein
MTPIATPTNGWGPMELDKSNGEAAAGDGRTISIGGIPSLKGLGVHAPFEARYALNGTCTGNFLANVGLDDEVGDSGSVVFQVFLDGVQAYDSGILRGTDARAIVSVPVAGKNELRLVVTNGGDNNTLDHADWASARVTGCGGVAPLVSNLSAKDTANAADWSLQGNLQVGNNVYGDRVYTFTQIPANLLGSTWIRTANDSKTFTGNPAVTFSLSAAADVFVAANDIGPKPAWLDATWVDTATNINTQEAGTARTYSVYRKRFVAGSVSLGPWGSGSSMYTVIVKP